MHSCGKRIWAIDLVRKHVESMKKVVGKMDEKSRHCENGPMCYSKVLCGAHIA